MKLDKHFAEKKKLIDQELLKLLPKKTLYPQLIHQAMHYSVFDGGKRFRPILTLACCEACGGIPEEALIPACALELIHSYSLIHDDLPALDNDNLRRGKPSCHRKFGEAYALLAGDALLTLSFNILARSQKSTVALRLITEISRSIGTKGMIGGQTVEKIHEGKKINLPTLDFISVNKTGQLIKISCLSGAICAQANKQEEQHITRYGECMGLAFQIVDDIIDGNGYMRFLNLKEARQKAEEVVRRAKKELDIFKAKRKRLVEIAEFVLERKK